MTNATCVFFNFAISKYKQIVNDKEKMTQLHQLIDNWDTTGCVTVYDPANTPDSVLCQCTHLTNFACLVVSLF